MPAVAAALAGRTDSALMAAATLSNRYITDRFLPDKAIDLVDEAASRLRMQVDSKPEELDELDRRLMQLKIEREALRKEDDPASQPVRPVATATATAADPAQDVGAAAYPAHPPQPIRTVSAHPVANNSSAIMACSASASLSSGGSQ